MSTQNNMNQSNTEVTSSSNGELLGLQTNAQEQVSNYKSGELVQREHVEGTPFQIITIEQGSFLAVGNKRVTDYTTKEECKRMIEEKGWDLICTVVTIIAEHVADFRETD